MSIVRGLSAFTLLLATLFFGSIVKDKYETANLKLPTIDPNTVLTSNTNIERELKQLFATFFQDKQLPTFELPTIDNEAIVPYLPSVAYPNAVTNAAQLGQAMASHMANFDQQYTLYYEGASANFNEVLDEAYSWMEQNEPYLWAILSESSYRATAYAGYIELQVTMHYDLTAEQNALVHGKVKQITESIDASLTDAEKVKFVNDYLVTQTKYNTNSAVNPYTPYAVLFHGEAVCEGYALAAYLMLNELGVETKYVIGDAGGPHAWNLVKIDGKWYHLDTTWNDPIPDQGKNVRYDYFLLSDRTIAKDHAWDKTMYPVALEDYL